jgi:hypothetical protein
MNDWIETKVQKPIAFDLVIVMDNKGYSQKGWWTGGGWDFGKKRIQGNVIKWRRCFEKNNIETASNGYILN